MKWFNTKDKLPEVYEEVLVACQWASKHITYRVAYIYEYAYSGWVWKSADDDEDLETSNFTILFWIPIDKPDEL